MGRALSSLQLHRTRRASLFTGLDWTHPKSIFQCRTEAKHTYLFTKVACIASCFRVFPRVGRARGQRSRAYLLQVPYTSLVPRPSASRARIAYVTFEPLSDSFCQLSDKGSKVTYAMRVRLADGLGTRLAVHNKIVTDPKQDVGFTFLLLTIRIRNRMWDLPSCYVPVYGSVTGINATHRAQTVCTGPLRR